MNTTERDFYELLSSLKHIIYVSEKEEDMSNFLKQSDDNFVIIIGHVKYGFKRSEIVKHYNENNVKLFDIKNNLHIQLPQKQIVTEKSYKNLLDIRYSVYRINGFESNKMLSRKDESSFFMPIFAVDAYSIFEYVNSLQII